MLNSLFNCRHFRRRIHQKLETLTAAIVCVPGNLNELVNDFYMAVCLGKEGVMYFKRSDFN